MCTLCFSVCFGCLAAEVIAVAWLAWQRVMHPRTIKAAAVCMSTSMRTAVNLRAPQRDSSFLSSSASARAHVDHCWQRRGFAVITAASELLGRIIQGFGVNLAFIDHWIELHWINGMHRLENLCVCAVRWTTGERRGGAFNQHSALAISAVFCFFMSAIFRYFIEEIVR